MTCCVHCGAGVDPVIMKVKDIGLRKLFLILLKANGETVSYDRLGPNPAAVHVYVNRLRQDIRSLPYVIINESKVGYQMRRVAK